MFPVFGEGALQLSDGNNTLADTNLWHALDDSVDVANLDAMGKLERIKSTLQNARVMPSLGGQTGAYFTKVTLNIPQKGQYFVIVNANFIDIGLASYSSSYQPTPTFQVFSQLQDDSTPPLLHFQAITVQTATENEQVDLWLLVKACTG